MLPTLRSPGRMSRAVFEGIPSMWNTHWFRRAFLAGIPDPITGQTQRPDYISLHATSFENPNLTEVDVAAIESDRDLLTDKAWRRMYLAEFSEDAGYFTNVTACIYGEPIRQPIPGATYVAGADLGRKIDPSVFTVMDAQERKAVSQLIFDPGTDWSVQLETAQRMTTEWGIKSWVVDATGLGDVFVSNMVEKGLPVEEYMINPASREFLLNNLAVSLERETVSFPQSFSQLIRELRAFQSRKLPSGHLRPEAPPGEHDDTIFSVALGLTACAEPPSMVAKRTSLHQPSRYVPTQVEANAGYMANPSRGAMMMRERRQQRTITRLEEMGIDIDRW